MHGGSRGTEPRSPQPHWQWQPECYWHTTVWQCAVPQCEELEFSFQSFFSFLFFLFFFLFFFFFFFFFDDETAFIGYRLLLAAPYPPPRARKHGFYVAAELGAVFAMGDARRMRRTCNEWVEWSERRLDAIAGRWKAALLREAQHAAPA